PAALPAGAAKGACRAPGESWHDGGNRGAGGGLRERPDAAPPPCPSTFLTVLRKYRPFGLFNRPHVKRLLGLVTSSPALGGEWATRWGADQCDSRVTAEPLEPMRKSRSAPVSAWSTWSM